MRPFTSGAGSTYNGITSKDQNPEVYHEVFIVAVMSICVIGIFASAGMAELRGEAVEYRDGDAVMEGYLVYDDAKQEYGRSSRRARMDGPQCLCKEAR